MCCEEFAPEPRQYRFTWYAAWSDGTPPAAGEGEAAPRPLCIDVRRGLTDLRAALADAVAPALLLDFGSPDWPARWCKTPGMAAHLRDERGPDPCWECPAVQRTARRAIRQLASSGASGKLVVVH